MNNNVRVYPRKNMEFSYKLIYTLITSLLIFFNTSKGMNESANSELALVDKQMQVIFETTIAVETTTFRKRIVQEQGIWKLIGFLGQKKWVDLEINLKTRIGFRLDGSNNVALAYDKQTDKYHVNVLEPAILDKHYSTRIIGQSDSFLSTWDINEFKNRQQEVIEEAIEAQSMQQLGQFKNNGGKMSQLVGRLQNKLQSNGDQKYWLKQIANNVNRGVLNKLDQVIRFITGKQSNQSINSKENMSQKNYVKNEKYKVFSNPQEIQQKKQQIKQEARLNDRQTKVRQFMQRKKEL